MSVSVYTSAERAGSDKRSEHAPQRARSEAAGANGAARSAARGRLAVLYVRYYWHLMCGMKYAKNTKPSRALSGSISHAI